MIRIKIYIFWGWIILSLFLSMFICSISLPIRDEYYPSIQDNISSIFFLSAGSVLLSSIINILNFLLKASSKVKLTISGILILAFLTIFSYLYWAMFPFSLLIIMAIIIIMVIGSIHFLLSCLLGKNIVYN
ncbi:hypothetical protein D0463_16040 [Bacillus sp. V59.32b]|nr:hypothetical protein D0463_16040 [Bacillus sp. V59.32b]